MARQANDGRGRMGGRAAGTPNRPKKDLLTWADELVRKKRAQFERDLQTLEPAQRAAIVGQIIAATLTANKQELKRITNEN